MRDNLDLSVANNWEVLMSEWDFTRKMLGRTDSKASHLKSSDPKRQALEDDAENLFEKLQILQAQIDSMIKLTGVRRNRQEDDMIVATIRTGSSTNETQQLFGLRHLNG